MNFLKIRTNLMLSSQAVASLQYGYFRTVENVFVHNFVTTKWCMGNIFLHNIDTYFYFVVRQMLCLFVSMADVIAWQMLYAILKLWQMLLPRGRCYLLIL